MANISKPSKLNLLWASGGDILDPGDTKYQTGWAVEVPPRQWENYIQNKQDQAIAHINQHGIPVWDSVTEYQEGESYTKGSDGVIYKAVVTNINVDPVGDLSGTWEQPFVTEETATKPASALQAQQMTDNDVYISPLQLENSFKGGNQLLSANGYQELPGGLILQWFTATITNTAGQSFPLPKTLPNGVLFAGAGEITESAGAYYFCQVFGTTNSTLSAALYGANPNVAPAPATGYPVKFFVVGF